MVRRLAHARVELAELTQRLRHQVLLLGFGMQHFAHVVDHVSWPTLSLFTSAASA